MFKILETFCVKSITCYHGNIVLFGQMLLFFSKIILTKYFKLDLMAIFSLEVHYGPFFKNTNTKDF